MEEEEEQQGESLLNIVLLNKKKHGSGPHASNRSVQQPMTGRLTRRLPTSTTNDKLDWQ